MHEHGTFVCKQRNRTVHEKVLTVVTFKRKCDYDTTQEAPFCTATHAYAFVKKYHPFVTSMGYSYPNKGLLETKRVCVLCAYVNTVVMKNRA